jgi:hypothetical protein
MDIIELKLNIWSSIIMDFNENNSNYNPQSDGSTKALHTIEFLFFFSLPR